MRFWTTLELAHLSLLHAMKSAMAFSESLRGVSRMLGAHLAMSFDPLSETETYSLFFNMSSNGQSFDFSQKPLHADDKSIGYVRRLLTWLNNGSLVLLYHFDRMPWSRVTSPLWHGLNTLCHQSRACHGLCVPIWSLARHGLRPPLPFKLIFAVRRFQLWPKF